MAAMMHASGPLIDAAFECNVKFYFLRNTQYVIRNTQYAIRIIFVVAEIMTNACLSKCLSSNRRLEIKN